MDEGRGFLDGATPETPKRAVGRPKGEYDEEMASKICDAISAGMTMREIEKLPGFPGCSTMYRWLRLYPDFNERYHMAQHWRAECQADEILAIADDKTGDYKIKAVLGAADGDTEIVDDEAAARLPTMVLTVNTTAIARSKLKIDARLNIMSKMSPDKWGPRAPAPAAAPAPTIIVIPPPPLPALPGDNAKQVNATVIDPLAAAIQAWKKQG